MASKASKSIFAAVLIGAAFTGTLLGAETGRGPDSAPGAAPAPAEFWVRVHVENPTPYWLHFYRKWGDSWNPTPPASIAPGTNAYFVLTDNDRGGVVYMAKDASGNEYGLVTMSFTCPELSDNSAEGSPSVPGLFLSAGLQTYSESGHPLDVTYKVGQPNRASWDDGSAYSSEIECDQTDMTEWARVLVSIENPTPYELRHRGTWGGPWEKSPRPLPPHSRRIFMLDDHNRGGIFYRAMDGIREVGYVTMSMTCPYFSGNSAEGSPPVTDVFLPAGLQHYDPTSSHIVHLWYRVGSPNLACWDFGNFNNGEIECDQTELNGRAKILVYNEDCHELVHVSHWDESGSSNAWFFNPGGSIPAYSHRLLVLSTNDRAGVIYYRNNIPYHLSFTAPELSSNSAEGSPFCGLQQYAQSGTPARFTYRIGMPNQAGWSSGSYNDGDTECWQTTVSSAPNWMRDTLHVIGERKLDEICIPGSHDSGMSEFGASTLWANPCTTITQTHGIRGQLERGCRFFDIRPVKSGGHYYTGHYTNAGTHLGITLGWQGANGQSIADVIDDVNDFTANHQELVILRLTDSRNTDASGSYPHLDPSQWTALLNQLVTQPNGLDHLLTGVPAATDLTERTISSLIGSSSRVLVIVDVEPGVSLNPFDGLGVFPAAALHNEQNHYSNTPYASVMVFGGTNNSNHQDIGQLAKLAQYRAPNLDNYFILSWTLTQDSALAFNCVFGSIPISVMMIAQTAKAPLRAYLPAATSAEVYPNVIMIDDVVNADFAVMAMVMNQRAATWQQPNIVDLGGQTPGWPTLDVGPPIIGTNMSISLTDGTPGAWGYIGFNQAISPLPLLGGVLRVGYQNPILVPVTLDGTGSYLTSYFIPAYFVPVCMIAQGALSQPTGQWGLTNAKHLQLGY